MHSYALIMTTVELGVEARRTELDYQNTSDVNNLTKLRELMNAGKNKEADRLRASFSTTEAKKKAAFGAYQAAFTKLVEHLKSRLNQSSDSLSEECYLNACENSKDDDDHFQKALETQIIKHLNIAIVEKKSKIEDVRRPAASTTISAPPAFAPQPSRSQSSLSRVTLFVAERDDSKRVGVREFIGEKISQLIDGFPSQGTAFIHYSESEGLQFHFQNGQYAQALEAKYNKSYHLIRLSSRLKNQYGTFASCIVFPLDQIERFLREELKLDEQNIGSLYDAIGSTKPQEHSTSGPPHTRTQRGGCTLL